MRQWCIGLGLVLVVGAVAGTVPVRAAVALADGRAVPGLEQQPRETLWWAWLADGRWATDQWFWYRVATYGNRAEAQEGTEAADDLAASFPRDLDAEWLFDQLDVAEPEALEAAVRMTDMGWRSEGGEAPGVWPAPPAEMTIGLRVGQASGAAVMPQAATLSVMGGGLALGLLASRRRP